MADGQLVPCVVRRWLDCGNVRTTPLAQIPASPAWQRTLALEPRRSYLVSGRIHGIAPIDAIHTALIGNPWLPAPAAS